MLSRPSTATCHEQHVSSLPSMSPFLTLTFIRIRLICTDQLFWPASSFVALPFLFFPFVVRLVNKYVSVSMGLLSLSISVSGSTVPGCDYVVLGANDDAH